MRIDIVKSALMGYKTIWEEREYLLKLAIVPVLIKFISTVCLFVFEVDLTSVSHILFMLPAYFVLGWMIAQFTRTVLTGERWPMRLSTPPTESEVDFMVWRARGLMSCMLFFVLTTMLQAGVGLYMTYLQGILEEDAAQVSSFGGGVPQLLASLVLLYAVIWGFRLLWLFIPLVILAPMKDFLKNIKGIKTSFYIIGTWLLAIVPIMFAVMVITSIFVSPEQTTIMEGSSVSGFVLLFITSVGEVLAQMVAVTALAYAFKDILIKYGAKPIFREPKKPL